MFLSCDTFAKNILEFLDAVRIHSVSLLNSILFRWKIFSLLSSDPIKQGRTNGFIKYIYFRLNGRSNYIPLMQENSWNQLKVPQSVKQNIKRPDQKLHRFTDSKQSVRELSVQLTYLSCLLLFPFFNFHLSTLVMSRRRTAVFLLHHEPMYLPCFYRICRSARALQWNCLQPFSYHKYHKKPLSKF